MQFEKAFSVAELADYSARMKSSRSQPCLHLPFRLRRKHRDLRAIRCNESTNNPLQVAFGLNPHWIEIIQDPTKPNDFPGRHLRRNIGTYAVKFFCTGGLLSRYKYIFNNISLTQTSILRHKRPSQKPPNHTCLHRNTTIYMLNLPLCMFLERFRRSHGFQGFSTDIWL